METTELKLVLLGTGTPNADANRFGPSAAVIVDGQAYVVDCGAGVVRRAAAAYEKGIEPLKPAAVRYLFLTHLHSDHTTGLADMILTPAVLGRSQPLEVYGPQGTKEMVSHILQAYQADIDLRIKGLEPAEKDAYRVLVTEIEEGVFFKNESVQVEAVPVIHGEWPCFAFVFTAVDKKVVVSGDTAPSEKLVKAAENCDLLLHEVYSETGLQGRPSDWQTYHRSMHTSSVELGKLAARIQPGLLVLYHQLFWGTSEDALVREVKSQFEGAVISGNDLEVYEI